ncbi:branched-chain amino acid ABC transporter permease [Egicoccus halophilus]|uniref:Branched-chain amino acid ABC transporter permease n=1 Tax=Egicoccus halophilus TaxID=1670830 RepID=A0A8J3A826_9ACTN|nr:branched-chain amino acid ABC transporter permease [Egicoccus halophilus]GGI06019.1 branched-chain amino acid ABC transporter permease [Egicoccus halophilus]
MEDLLTILVRGVAQGSVYALLAAGFVVIYRATDVVNFAQPALMVLGAYFTALFVRTYEIPFPLAILGSILVVGMIGAACERIALRPMVGEPPFSAAMVTVGVFLVLTIVANRLIGSNVLTVGDPWGLDTAVLAGGVRMRVADGWRIALTAGAFAGVGLFLARSRVGLAMRATSLDQEVALAQGVNVGRMFGLSWAMAGGLAGLAGMMVGSGGQGVDNTTAFVALKALPVIILGGLDSLKGAYIGGLVIGVAEAFTRANSAALTGYVGANVDVVVPYVIMILVLMVRPYGLFGTPEVQRV